MKMTWKYGQSGLDNSRLSYLIGYLYDEVKLKQHLGITGTSYEFTSMTPETKTFYLYRLTRPIHATTGNIGNSDKLFSGPSTKFVVLLHALPHAILRYKHLE